MLVAAAPACTEFESGSDVLDEEQRSLAEARPGEDWACIDGVDLTDPPATPAIASSENRLVYSARIVDLSTGVVYPDLVLRACGVSDPECVTPVVDGLRVNAQGWVDVPLFDGFIGYFEMRSPELLSSLFFFSEPLSAGARNVYPFGVVSIASVPALVQVARIDQSEGTGFIAARAFDCTNTPARDIVFEIEEQQGSSFYFIDGLPTGNAAATDGSGLGGFGNVPPGLAIVKATRRDGTPIQPPQSVVIRPGWLTTLFAAPPRRLRAP